MLNEGNYHIVPDLVEKIRPLMSGKDPDIQGAALGELVAIYFVGHPKEIRSKAFHLWLEMVHDLIDIFDDGLKNPPKKNSEKN